MKPEDHNHGESEALETQIDQIELVYRRSASEEPPYFWTMSRDMLLSLVERWAGPVVTGSR